MHITRVATVLTLAALCVAAEPQVGPARVIKDINQLVGEESASAPSGFVQLGGITLFAATTRTAGRELWRTDGTDAGTVLVKDVFPGVPNGVNALFARRVGGTVFFAAWDGVRGAELWKTDGSEAGTVMVKDIRSGSGSAFELSGSITSFQSDEAGGILFFLANDGVHGNELWRSDGTESGTFLLQDIYPGFISGFGLTPELRSVAIGGTLFFVASDNVSGVELWKSDGTQDGTGPVVDFPSGFGDPSLFAEVGGVLLFSVSHPALGRELWRSDGTVDGTYPVSDIRPGEGGSAPSGARAVNGALYFLANDGTHGVELWRSDGTFEGTTLVKDIRPGAGSGAIATVAALDDRLLFIAADDTHGQELWVSDGTEAGTHLVKELIAGVNLSFNPLSFTRAGSTLYFALDDGVHGPELWKTDGTEGGTAMLTDDPSLLRPRAFVEVRGRLYFERAVDPYGSEPWVTDGTPSGTKMLRDVMPGARSSVFSDSVPGKLGDRVLFTANDGVYGRELWITDGTPEGTALAKDVNTFPRTSDSRFASPIALGGGRILFSADDGVHGAEPWVTDGTEAGTHLVRDIRPGLPASFLGEIGTFRPLQGKGYFTASDGVHGFELWASDGTEAGTRMVKEITPPNSRPPFTLAVLDSVVLFSADDGVHGDELWATDGTEAGTRLVKDIYPGPARSEPSGGVRIGNALFFHATDGTPGTVLWRTDGTEAGTFPIVGIPNGWLDTPVVRGSELWFLSGDEFGAVKLWRSDGTVAGTENVADLPVAYATELCWAGDTLYFAAEDADFRVGIWASDGTGVGTHLLKELYPGYLRPIGDTLYFVAFDSTYGPELWKSDGTEAGTVLIKDIWPGDRNVFTPEIIMNVGDVVLFNASDGERGIELWRTDGTEAGTFLVQDLLPGPASSFPVSFLRFGSRLIFGAIDDAAGREPWIARTAILTRQPALAFADLADDVRALRLPAGIERSLTAKLDAAASALGLSNGSRTATRLLYAFTQAVDAHSPNPISEAAAADLLDFVREIEELLGSANAGTPALPLVGPSIGGARVVSDEPR